MQQARVPEHGKMNVTRCR